jgi:hypothetical protein
MPFNGLQWKQRCVEARWRPNDDLVGMVLDGPGCADSVADGGLRHCQPIEATVELHMSVLGFIFLVILVLYIAGSIFLAFIRRSAHDDFRKHR